MAFAEPRATFFNVDQFADVATLDGEEVVGIFDAEYMDALNVESSGPAFTLITEDAAAAHGVELEITTGYGTGTWKVRGIQPDGTGVTVLRLEKQ